MTKQSEDQTIEAWIAAAAESIDYPLPEGEITLWISHFDPCLSKDARLLAAPDSQNSSGYLRFTEAELAHAFFTTGRVPGNQREHGASSWFELIHRLSVVPAYLRRSAANEPRLARSELARSLDRSEKVHLSYQIGQAIAGIAARKLFDVTHPMHIDRYRNHWDVQTIDKKAPDLFGQNSEGGWVVIEAKGRSNPLSPANSLDQTMKAQVGAVQSVNDAEPAWGVGSAAYFAQTGGAEALRLRLIDPPPSETAIEPVTLRTDANQFMLAYYEPLIVFLNAMGNGEEQDGLVIASAPSIGLAVGLRASIKERIERAISDSELDGLADDIRRQLATEDLIYADGSAFFTDWPSTSSGPIEEFQ